MDHKSQPQDKSSGHRKETNMILHNIDEFEELIEKAKLLTERHSGETDPRWIETSALAYYGSSKYPTKLFVLEGS
jgi:hypothetical protein